MPPIIHLLGGFFIGLLLYFTGSATFNYQNLGSKAPVKAGKEYGVKVPGMPFSIYQRVEENTNSWV